VTTKIQLPATRSMMKLIKSSHLYLIQPSAALATSNKRLRDQTTYAFKFHRKVLNMSYGSHSISVYIDGKA